MLLLVSFVVAVALEPPLAKSPPQSILVVGGSGRVGASTVRHLRRLTADDTPLHLAIGGRSRANFEKAAARLASLGIDDVDFVRVDLDVPDELRRAVAGRACVVHTAGPFQGRSDPALLDAALAENVPYVDVCDEWPLSRASKERSAQAKSRGLAAVVSCGIWPGVSALMAAEAVSRLEHPKSLDFAFFTAGTGNAGPTIVSATFLLLCQEALTYKGGVETPQEPWTSPRVVDFGATAGERTVRLLDNPDVPTCAHALGVPSISSRFATAPGTWNLLFGAMKSLPRALLADEDKMMKLALFSEPIIRLVDRLVGATNAMRVDATDSSGQTVTLRVVHPDLEACVGLATAAFALEAMRGTIPGGVHYPAELPSQARASILEAVREGAVVWELGQPFSSSV